MANLVARAGEFHPAFVTPRYGEEVIGGAEDLARRTAEELARRGHRVSALSTCALDHHTWTNHFPEGSSEINGVAVHRFAARTGLGDPGLHRVLTALNEGRRLTEKEQRRWLDGVVMSDGLVAHLREEGERYSHIIFLPYLFGTTYYGSGVMPDRSYIVPCLHDEPYAYQPLILDSLRKARGLIFNSPGERRLASKLLGIADPGPVVGMGFEQLKGDPAAFRDRTDVRGEFMLYAGRREEGKNTPLLIDYFRRLTRDHPGIAELVLMGSGEISVPFEISHSLHDLGRVSEQHKWDGYSAASIFCQPSVNESFSIVLMEAWLAGAPALVHSGCAVTSDHVRESGGGLTFSSYPEFAEAVRMLVTDRELGKTVGENGKRYVLEMYNWESVMKRLLEALEVKP